MHLKLVNLCADLEKIFALAQRMMYVVESSLSIMSTEVQKTYDDIFDTVERKLFKYLSRVSKKIKNHFQG